MTPFVQRLIAGHGRRMPVAAALFAGAAVLALSLALLPGRIDLVRNTFNVGHADQAAYALQARSLVRGDGLTIPYVSNFYIPYSPAVCRLDDHWPQLVPVLLAPSFRLWGVDAAVARKTMMAWGTICLPLAAAWLAGVATHRAWGAVLGGLWMLLPATVLQQSSQIMGDVAVTTLVCVYAACLLMARRRPAWYLGAGVAGALAFYGKGSQAILLPLLPALAVASGGWRVLRRRRLWSGVAAFVLLVAPWWTVNARLYGNPFHSTQNYVSAFFGLSEGIWDDWDTNFYAVHWGQDLPRMSDRFRDGEAFKRSLWRNGEVYARALCLGFDASFADWTRMGRHGHRVAQWVYAHSSTRAPPKPRRGEPDPSTLPAVTHPRQWPAWHETALQVTGAAWGVLAVAAWAATGLRRWGGRLRGRLAHRPLSAAAGFPPFGGAATLAILAAAQALFVVVLWRAIDRFTLPVIPLVATLGLMGVSAARHGVSSLLRRIPGARCRPIRSTVRHARWLVVGLLCLAAVQAWDRHAADVAAWQQRESGMRPSRRPAFPRYAELGRRLAEVLPPDAVVMSRNPWELLFYAPPSLRAVGLPYATPDVLFGVARYYGVTHLVFDKDRPGLREFIQSAPPALSRVIDAPYPVYAIDYAAFRDGECADPSHLGSRGAGSP